MVEYQYGDSPSGTVEYIVEDLASSQEIRRTALNLIEKFCKGDYKLIKENEVDVGVGSSPSGYSTNYDYERRRLIKFSCSSED